MKGPRAGSLRENNMTLTRKERRTLAATLGACARVAERAAKALDDYGVAAIGRTVRRWQAHIALPRKGARR